MTIHTSIKVFVFFLNYFKKCISPPFSHLLSPLVVGNARVVGFTVNLGSQAIFLPDSWCLQLSMKLKELSSKLHSITSLLWDFLEDKDSSEIVCSGDGSRKHWSEVGLGKWDQEGKAAWTGKVSSRAHRLLSGTECTGCLTVVLCAKRMVGVTFPLFPVTRGRGLLQGGLQAVLASWEEAHRLGTLLSAGCHGCALEMSVGGDLAGVLTLSAV